MYCSLFQGWTDQQRRPTLWKTEPRPRLQTWLLWRHLTSRRRHQGRSPPLGLSANVTLGNQGIGDLFVGTFIRGEKIYGFLWGFTSFNMRWNIEKCPVVFDGSGAGTRTLLTSFNSPDYGSLKLSQEYSICHHLSVLLKWHGPLCLPMHMYHLYRASEDYFYRLYPSQNMTGTNRKRYVKEEGEFERKRYFKNEKLAMESSLWWNI